jgi:hypothetical protein
LAVGVGYAEGSLRHSSSAKTSLGGATIAVGVVRYVDGKTLGILILKIQISFFKKMSKNFEKNLFFAMPTAKPSA